MTESNEGAAIGEKLTQYGLELIGSGLSILPIRHNKRPGFPWKPFQERAMSREEFLKRIDGAEAIAVVCGGSAGFEALDFDVDSDTNSCFKPWNDAVDARAPDLIEKLYVERSPSGGYHVVFRSPGSVEGNQVLARSSVEAGRKVKIETRGEGGFLLVAPSPGYEVVQGELAQLQEISKEERKLLFKAAREFDELACDPLNSAVLCDMANAQSSEVVTVDWKQVLEKFNANEWPRIFAELGSRGWTKTGEDAKQEYWRRPGKKEEHSATFDRKTFYNFSPNADPLLEGAHDAVDLFIAFELGREILAEWRDRTSPGHREAVDRVFRELEKLGYAPVAPPSCAGPGICIAKSRPVREILDCASRSLIDAGRFFCRDGSLFVFHSDGRHETVKCGSHLASLLTNLVAVHTHSKSGIQHHPFPREYASAWLAGREQILSLPEIRLLAEGPVVSREWKLLGKGYDAQSRILCTGPHIVPLKGAVHLGRLLSGFCFQEPGDRTNFIAMLLTAMLMPHFVGAKPALLLTANQRGLGKTLLAQLLTILRSGRPASTLTFHRSDEELEKAIGAACMGGETTIVIDNADGAGGRVLRSAVLERSITDRRVSFRILGRSVNFEAENSYMFVVTANRAKLSPDFLDRSVAVRLHYDGNPRHRPRFDPADPLAYAQNHRREILGELAAMIFDWRDAGALESGASFRFAETNWAPIVGGILANAGLAGFLDNVDAVTGESDEEYQAFAALIETMALEVTTQRTKSFTASRLLDLAKSRNLSLLAGGTAEMSRVGAAMSFGRFIHRFLGVQFHLDSGRSVTFVRVGQGKNAPYALRFDGERGEAKPSNGKGQKKPRKRPYPGSG